MAFVSEELLALAKRESKIAMELFPLIDRVFQLETMIQGVLEGIPLNPGAVKVVVGGKGK